MANDAAPVAGQTGWTSSSVTMGDYQDYCMNAGDGRSVAGVCHARGDNAGLPAAWMIYIVVADPDAAMERCKAGGGKLMAAPNVSQDPAGAIAALYESRSQAE